MKQLKRFKILVGWLIIALTVAAFYRYIASNPAVWWQLQKTSLATIVMVIIGYAAMTALLAWLYQVMTSICKVAIPRKENLLLTMYSSVVNFFGPLQSGPGFRTVYLRKKYGINIAAYIGLSAWYYACFASVSGLLLLSGWLGWWVLTVAPVVAILYWKWTPRALHKKLSKLTLVMALRQKLPSLLPIRQLLLLLVLSAMQVVIVAVIYFIELHSLSAGVTFQQALIYTGAANFALFVSLTPGALGFRESFLYFSRNLHGINEQIIVSANILDRGVYVLFLGIVFILILGLHGQEKFNRVVSK